MAVPLLQANSRDNQRPGTETAQPLPIGSLSRGQHHPWTLCQAKPLAAPSPLLCGPVLVGAPSTLLTSHMALVSSTVKGGIAKSGLHVVLTKRFSRGRGVQESAQNGAGTCGRCSAPLVSWQCPQPSTHPVNVGPSPFPSGSLNHPNCKMGTKSQALLPSSGGSADSVRSRS